MRPAIRDAARLVFGALLILTALLSWASGFSIPYLCLSQADETGLISSLGMLGLFAVVQALNCVMLFAGIHLLATRPGRKEEPSEWRVLGHSSHE